MEFYEIASSAGEVSNRDKVTVGTDSDAICAYTFTKLCPKRFPRIVEGAYPGVASSGLPPRSFLADAYIILWA